MYSFITFLVNSTTDIALKCRHVKCSFCTLLYAYCVYLCIFICVVFYVYDCFYIFGLMECENKLQLQLPEQNNVLIEQCGQEPKVRIQYFKYIMTH